ncbi:MAG: ATP synthase F1 subunit delta [Acidimicrobiales bacterium]
MATAATNKDRIAAYAEAMFAVARAEGNLAEVGDELFRFARALETNDELRQALTDPHLPVARRQQIVEDILGEHATPTTVALVSMAVGAGRGRDLPEIIDLLVKMSAAEANKEVAEVRSAVELSDEQRRRLAEALEKATGKAVEVKVVVDPTVLGGIVATIGDTVIDGSVRSRLEQLRSAF